MVGFLRMGLLVSAAVAVITPALAAQGDEGSKAIRALPAAKPLQLSAAAGRAKFGIEEPLSMKLEIDRPAYLYMYSRGSDGRSQFVYPTLGEEPEKLTAGKQVRRVGAADSAGEEELIVFASEQPLDLVDEETTAGLPTRAFEKRLSAAGVRIGSSSRSQQLPGISLPQSVMFTVVDRSAARQAPTAGVALVATDKANYKVGDSLQLVFGANKPGYVQLFVRYPDGKIEPLLKQKFDAPGIFTQIATADIPSGEQTILAVHSTDGKLTPRMLSAAGYATEGAGADKAIRLRTTTGNPDLAISSRVIQIEE